MDGFPRSANSYAMFAFKQANPGATLLAGHSHSSQLVLYAAKRGIPCVVIVREPIAVGRSMARYMPYLSPAEIMHSYTQFHHRLLRAEKGKLLAIEFDDVVRDFGEVISTVNGHYGTNFIRYEKTPNAEAQVLQQLDASDTERNRGRLDPMTVSRPHAARADVVASPEIGANSDPALEGALEAHSLLLAKFAT